MKKITISLFALLLLQSCAATPIKSENKQSYADNRFSIDKIKKKRENIYAVKLLELNNRNPVSDVKSAVARKNYYLLSYNSGRGGMNKVPGVTPQQLAKNHCDFRALEGLGDSIYGENHLKYRVAIRRYANTFNKMMLSYCY